MLGTFIEPGRPAHILKLLGYGKNRQTHGSVGYGLVPGEKGRCVLIEATQINRSGIGSNSSLLPLFSLDLVRSRAERRKHHHWLNSRQSKGCRDERRTGRYRRRLERLRESSLQELSQLGPSPELRDQIQFLNTEVNALDRPQIVRARNSSYFGSK